MLSLQPCLHMADAMLVQIYGVTTVADAAAVHRLGADLIGVVVDEGIPTWDAVDEATARAIGAAVTSARLVALSLSTDPLRVRATANLLRPSVVHLARAHLMTTSDLCHLRADLEAEMMLTVPVQGPESLSVASRLADTADILLVDSVHPETGVVGASGLTHDWDVSAQIVSAVDTPVLLAGGLGPHNVEAAIDRVRPAGVDSETHTSCDDDRRRKDLGKVELFVDIVRNHS